MATHNETGKKGEDLAICWLQEKQFSILFRNWRHQHLETDIIAHKEGILHFIEVKTSRSRKQGLPEDRVHNVKWERMRACAEAFLHQYKEWDKICFDILSITLINGLQPEFYWIEDCYNWH